MAEFCLECWNRINGTAYTSKDLKESKGFTLCEGCGEVKRCLRTYTPPEKLPIKQRFRRWRGRLRWKIDRWLEERSWDDDTHLQ